MPLVDLDDVRIHYRLDGQTGMPVLVLSNSLGAALQMWDAVLPALAGHFHVLRYDTLGHGRSSAPPGPYTIPQLAGNVLSLLDALKIEACHFCGVSLGGMTGIWLGIHHPHRVKSLALSNTAARIGSREGWEDRIRSVRERGLAAMADGILGRWFTPEFRAAHPNELRAMLDALIATAPEGYAGCCAAMQEMDMSSDLARIGAPTLVVAGTQDPVIPIEGARALHEGIRNSDYVAFDSAHLTPIDQAAEFAHAVLRFLRASGARDE